jgi:hypothetical protein
MSVRKAVFASLEGAELTAAVSAITRAGLDPAHFALEERRTEQTMARGGAVHKLISIKSLASGTQRQYSTGRGGGWPFEFERDLRVGFYGAPWPARPGIFNGAEAAE